MAEDVKFREESGAVDTAFSDVPVFSEGGRRSRETSRTFAGG